MQWLALTWNCTISSIFLCSQLHMLRISVWKFDIWNILLFVQKKIKIKDWNFDIISFVGAYLKFVLCGLQYQLDLIWLICLSGLLHSHVVWHFSLSLSALNMKVLVNNSTILELRLYACDECLAILKGVLISIVVMDLMLLPIRFFF